MAEPLHHLKIKAKDAQDYTQKEYEFEMQDAKARSDINTINATAANIQNDVTRQKNNKIDSIFMENGQLYATSNGNIVSGPLSDFVDPETKAQIDDLAEYKVDGAFTENGYLYLTSNEVVVAGPLGPFSGGGGGGGGGGGTSIATMRIENTSGWLTTTITKSDTCNVSFTWESVENEMSTGDGSLRIMVNNTIKAVTTVPQGENTIDISPYVTSGTNKIALTVTDMYGNERTLRCTVIVVALSLSSSLDVSAPYSGSIDVPYTPTGNVMKTMHFILDGHEIGTASTTVSARELRYSIPQQSHGAHTLRMYFEAEVNGQTVRSNELYFEITCIAPGNVSPIITSSYSKTQEKQYDTLTYSYSVYNPSALTTEVTILVNDEEQTTLTVGRNVNVFSYRLENAGPMKIEIRTGEQGAPDYASKVTNITVQAVDINIHAETEALALYLNSRGRSNNEANREEWKYNDISATLTGFSWIINGWVNDRDGITVLRLNDTARVTIPYQIFGTDFKETGKTIELEFATRDVVDYGADIISCMSGGVGLRVTPQAVYFNGSQTSLFTPYKEDEHIRVSITVQAQTSYRLIIIYINGIASSAIQYGSGERFSQLEPVGITIGSSDCGIDLYNIRIYDKCLTDREVVENWVADTQIGSLMLDRYSRNNVYNESMEITPETLPSDLLYMILELEELPKYKGDVKEGISGRYVDPVDPTKSFTFTGCDINVQGTSSAIYYRKNWDLKFKGGFTMSSGMTNPKYALRDGSIPFNRFVLKADVASSEGANNTGLTMLYNQVCPYKTPEMVANPNVRWGIEGIPIVLFWYNPKTGITEFLGKHNFNLPKRAAGPYGYDGNDESWEFERNNSDNVKFKDFDITSINEQTLKPEWYNDWEARFPDDTWRNTDKLGEFVRWVVSTDRTQATNEALPSPVTYTLNTTRTVNLYPSDSSYEIERVGEGSSTVYNITFTKDTPAYRLTKFRAEADDYMELESFEFYYIFTTQFMMIDSWAKNMFIGTHGSAIQKEG